MPCASTFGRGRLEADLDADAAQLGVGLARSRSRNDGSTLGAASSSTIRASSLRIER
jgi:hypothetical protein